MTPSEILSQRKNKFLKIGRSKGFMSNLENLSALEIKKNNIKQFFEKKKNIFFLVAGILSFTALLINYL